MISGFLVLDKPVDWTTFDLIRDIRKKSGIRKIGHTGTLDPFATGLVILPLASFTRLSSLLLGSEKEYLVEMELGIKTDTGDITGEVISRQALPSPDKDLLDGAVKEILQLETQIPPRFSALKIDGQRAYKLARENRDFDLKERAIKIHSFEINSVNDNLITYRTRVSKGTYIRALSETFAEKLGTIAYTKTLRRIAVGDITIDWAVSPSDINEDNWQNYLKSVTDILPEFPKVFLQEDKITPFRNGNPVELDNTQQEGEVLVFGSSLPDDEHGNCLGLAEIRDGVLLPRRVFV